MANGFLNRADDIDPSHPTTSRTRGYVRISEGAARPAKQEFDNAIMMHQDVDICSKLGKASVEFGQGKYHDALKLFKEVITINPYSPLDVYYSLAQCHYKIGDSEKAKRLFKLILAKDPQHEDTLVASALIETESFYSLTNAFKLYPNNPHVLLKIGEVYYHKEDLGRAANCANRGISVLSHLEINEGRSELNKLLC
jgi:tetratricopeptide (TPR) repeat protein